MGSGVTWARVYGSEDWHRISDRSATGAYVRAACGELFTADAETPNDPRSDPKHSTGWIFVCPTCRGETWDAT